MEIRPYAHVRAVGGLAGSECASSVVDEVGELFAGSHRDSGDRAGCRALWGGGPREGAPGG